MLPGHLELDVEPVGQLAQYLKHRGAVQRPRAGLHGQVGAAPPVPARRQSVWFAARLPQHQGDGVGVELSMREIAATNSHPTGVCQGHQPGIEAAHATAPCA